MREIIAHGEIHQSHPTHAPECEINVTAYHWLTAKVLLGGRQVTVGVTLREDNWGNLYYNHNPIKERVSDSPDRTRPAHKAASSPESDTHEESLEQTGDFVNERDSLETKATDSVESGASPQAESGTAKTFNQSASWVGADINLALLNQGEQNRGAFNPATLSITLLKNADLSTFLHESGHFFLEMQADIAARPEALDAIKQDMDTLLAWFGVSDLPTWHALTLEEKCPFHEQYARGFEAYLFEGTSPSLEMQGLFSRFRAWLVNIYKDITALGSELTPEVRGVFDRLLATEEAILQAEQGRNMFPLFESAEQAGLSPLRQTSCRL